MFTDYYTVIDPRHSDITYLIHCNFFRHGSKKYQVTFEPPSIFMVSKPLKIYGLFTEHRNQSQQICTLLLLKLVLVPEILGTETISLPIRDIT